MKSIKFTVPGNPFGKQRPKFARMGTYTKTYTPKKTTQHEKEVAECFLEVARGRRFKEKEPLDIRIIAYYPIPQSTSKKRRKEMLEHRIRPTVKPDLDNVAKLIYDALNGVAWYDDNAIVDTQGVRLRSAGRGYSGSAWCVGSDGYVYGYYYGATATVLDGQYAGDVGYNPGSQMIQIAGITFLSEYDHMMREQTEAEDYGRYMDDSTLFHPSKEYLENLKLINEKYLASRGMEYNSKKTKVFSIKEGFTFLGFKYRLTDTGKVIMTVSSEKVKERRRKLRKLVRKAKRGEITKAKVDDCYQAWRSHASKGNSFHLIRRMDKFYKSLWNDQETEVTDNEN